MTYLFLCLPHSSFPLPFQGEFLNKTEAQAYQLILSLKFNEADALLQHERPASIYLKSLSESLQLVISEDSEAFKEFDTNHDNRLSQLKSLKVKNAERAFYLAEMNIHSAFVNLKFSHEFKAAWQIKRAYKLISQNNQDFPEFLPNKKTLGLLHVLIGSVPQKYQWIVSLFGMEGSVESGLKELESISLTNNHYQTESRIIQSMIYSYLLGKPKIGLQVFNNTYDKELKNEFLAYLNILLLIKNQQSHAAEIIFNNFSKDQIQTSLMHYAAGEIYLQKGSFDEASIQYESFISKHKGPSNIKDAHYKIFLCSYLKGAADAQYLRKQAIKLGESTTEADKYATKVLEQPTDPNPIILRVRLLTDGGYYNEAENLISSNVNHEFSDLKEKAEYEYRKARLADSQRQRNKAVEYYQKTVELSGLRPWYFAPNSCLHLGSILREQGNISEAKKYYNMVFDYKGYQYERSIENKAKRALEALD